MAAEDHGAVSRPGLDLIDLMPAVFVLIWSTGFVVAKLAMPHGPPLTFLCWRYVLSIGGLVVWALAARAPWPSGWRAWLHLAVTGVLMQGGYFGGVWAAVKLGLSPGLVALIVGLQPVLTAVWVQSNSSTARVARVQWLGLSLGLGGVVMVVWRKLGMGEANLINLGLTVMALLCITAGTLYQKAFVGSADVRTAGVAQLAGAFVVTLPLALLETEPLQWHADVIIALAWSVLALTMGASSLLYLLIQRGAAMKVTSLFYLVPPCTAVIAWALFGDPITPLVIAGMAATAAGVALVVRAPVQPAAR